MNFRRLALRELTRHELPVTIRTGSVGYDTAQRAIKAVARDLALNVDVSHELDGNVNVFTVSPAKETPKEKRKRELNMFNFATYAEYVRFSMKGREAVLSHFGMGRRQAHGAIRYAMKPHSVKIKKINSDKSKVTLL